MSILPIIIMVLFIVLAASPEDFKRYVKRTAPKVYRHPYQFTALIIIIETILSSSSEPFVMWFAGDSLSAIMYTTMLMGMLFIGAGILMMKSNHKLGHIMAFVYALGVSYVMIVLWECGRKSDGLNTIESFEISWEINIALQVMILMCWMGPGFYGIIKRRIDFDSLLPAHSRLFRRGDN